MSNENQFLTVDQIRARLTDNLEADYAYDRGFMDALESMALALESRGEGFYLNDLNTVLDALGNNDELGRDSVVDEDSPSP